MNEGQQPKSYYVQLPGYQQGEIWDEDKFNRNKDQLFRDHPDAIALETTPTAGQSEIVDNDSYSVHLPGFPEAEIWDGAKLSRNYQQLLQDHPDAEIARTKQVNYWGDKLFEIEDRMKALKTELGKLPAETEVPELAHMDDEDLIQEAGRLRDEKPGLRRRRELNNELEQLYRERENNPAWKNYWFQMDRSIDDDLSRIDKMQTELDESNPEAAKAYRAARTSLMGGPQNAGLAAIQAAASDKDYNNAVESFAAARLMLDDAKKAAEAPSKYGGDDYGAWHDFWQGVKDGAPEALSEAQLLRLGLNMHLIDAIKKIQKEQGKDVKLLDFVQS